MPDRVLAELLEHYGLLGLLVVAASAMVAAAWAQIAQLRRWQPQTVQIVERTERMVQAMEQIISRLDRQHAACLRHHEFASEQVDGMKALGTELQSVVRSIHESDRERNREILQLVSLLAGRPRATD